MGHDHRRRLGRRGRAGLPRQCPRPGYAGRRRGADVARLRPRVVGHASPAGGGHRGAVHARHPRGLAAGGARGWRRAVAADKAREGARPDRPDSAAAESHYGTALTLASELGMRPLVAHCHLGLGALYRRTGDDTKAHEHLTTATAMYREMGMTFWLEKAEVG